MKPRNPFCCILLCNSNLVVVLLALFFSSSFQADASNFEISSNGGPFTNVEVHYINRRQLLYYLDKFGDRGENVTVNPSLVFENPRLRAAYIALESWKKAILSDPHNLTVNWDLVSATTWESSVQKKTRHSAIQR